MKRIDLLITPENAGQRLDRALRDAVPDLSRAVLQKAVLAGHCQVDGLPVTRPDAKTRLGQHVVLHLPHAENTLAAEEGHLELLWQDASLVVCNKPAGLTVHPCPSCPEHTLVQRLLGAFRSWRGWTDCVPALSTVWTRTPAAFCWRLCTKPRAWP